MDRSLAWTASALIVLNGLLAGCGKPPAPRGKVVGQVTVAGKPIPHGTIIFENGPGTEQTALIRDGSFEVKNYLGSGLPVGNYRVAVLPRAAADDDAAPLIGQPDTSAPGYAGPTIQEKYHSVDTSELRLEVKEGDNPLVQIDLMP